MQNDCALRHKLRVQGVHIIDIEIGEIAVIVDIAGRGGIRTATKHHSNLTADEALPIVSVAPLGPETQDIDEVSNAPV
jgi:hypothetical protein